MRGSKRLVSLFVSALVMLSSSAAFAETLFLKVQGEARGNVGYFGLLWDAPTQTVSVYGYRGGTLASSTRDKFFGKKTVAEMNTPQGTEITHRVRRIGITLATIRIKIKLDNVTRNGSSLAEGDLTVSAQGQGQATIRLTRNPDGTMRAAYQNRVTDVLYFKNGVTSLTPL